MHDLKLIIFHSQNFSTDQCGYWITKLLASLISTKYQRPNIKCYKFITSDSKFWQHDLQIKTKTSRSTYQVTYLVFIINFLKFLSEIILMSEIFSAQLLRMSDFSKITNIFHINKNSKWQSKQMANGTM